MDEAREVLKRLRALENKRRRLMTVLLQTEELAIGTLRRAKRPCGNPRCGNCADGPSHEQVVLYYTTKEGKRTSTFVRRSEEERFEKAARRYSEFRSTLRALKHLDSEEIDLLGALKESRAISRKA